MRLVRLAVASVNATVGAMRSNVDRALRVARAAAEDGATLVAFPEQCHRRVRAGGSRAVAALRGGAGGGARSVRARDGGARRCARPRRHRRARRDICTTARCSCIAGKVRGLVPKEKLPTYNVFYEARTFARGAVGLYDELDGVPFGDLVFESRFRHRGARGLRGHLVARRPDAPPVVCGRGARRERVGVARSASASWARGAR